MQKIGETGDGKSAVATPDGKKPKEEEEEDKLSNPSLVLDFRFLVTFMISCSSVGFMKKLVWQLSVR